VFNAPGSMDEPCDRCRAEGLLCRITPHQRKSFHPYRPRQSLRSSTRGQAGQTSGRDVQQEASLGGDGVEKVLPVHQSRGETQTGVDRSVNSQGRTESSSSQIPGTMDEKTGNDGDNEPLTESQEAAMILTKIPQS